jgi:hypothetical protein
MDELSNTAIALLFVLTLLIIIVVEYSLDVKKLYPKWCIERFQEPYVKFTCYVAIYMLACFSPLLAVTFALIVVFLHIDTLNLTKNIGYTINK